jgi:hypothetical protein
MLARRFIADWGAQAIVENKPGANNQVAAEYVARQPGDGYTLFIGPETTCIFHHRDRRREYSRSRRQLSVENHHHHRARFARWRYPADGKPFSSPPPLRGKPANEVSREGGNFV